MESGGGPSGSDWLRFILPHVGVEAICGLDQHIPDPAQPGGEHEAPGDQERCAADEAHRPGWIRRIDGAPPIGTVMLVIGSRSRARARDAPSRPCHHFVRAGALRVTVAISAG